ncbi:CHAT domain-containing protein [Sphingomonas sp.]|uniref:CHAT domain-containing protein n=1 Tax=Sphingomonas sp. TaxID=28214 RepID=UPI00389C1AC0
MSRAVIAITAALAGLAAAASSWAATPLSVRDSWRIGSSGTSFCSAQSLTVDKALTGMFDSGYSITCRDAALAVGKLYKIKDARSAEARLAADRAERAICEPAHRSNVAGIGAVDVIECKLKDADVLYRGYELRRGGLIYAAEGLSGYDSALFLGLRSLLADQPVKGEISIATTGLGDPAAFARVQAGTLAPDKALEEAYRRNNAGSYAEAAEFFAAASVGSADSALSRSEALVNEALQKSNLGRYSEADALFSRAAEVVGSDPIVARRLRNYRAIHDLNQGNSKAALAELDKPLPKGVIAIQNAAAGKLEIDSGLAQRLNADSKMGQQLSAQSDELLPDEKAAILDGQAMQLRGTALRLTGDREGAREALRRADGELLAVRGGKVASILWMRAQIFGDLGAIAEDSGAQAEAQRLYAQAVELLETNYPGSAVLLNAKARLAGYLARRGQLVVAKSMFADIVHSQPDTSNLPPSFANVLRPYVDLLLKTPDDPAALAETFAATQLMIRPGLAQTQAVLARELSGGTDEASRLFRQSVTLTRQVERARIELARLQDLAKPSPQEIVRSRVLHATLDSSQKEQLTTQAALADFPRFRAVSSDTIALADLQKILRPGEAYYRMTVAGENVYAMLVTPDRARAAKLAVSARQLDEQVSALRDTISAVENGKRITYPFDVALSHQLYGELFGPFAASIIPVTHLIFEPDGALLRLPPNLLVMDQASVDIYQQRAKTGEDAAYDFRGIAWLGRDRDISTAVSPRSFAQLRIAPPSAGRKAYLGLGENTPPSATAEGIVPAAADRDCILPLSSWAHPISATELETAGAIIRKFDPNGVEIVTRDQFTDTGLAARTDLAQYRILHFATHGVVTARAAKCAAQPALLTSFGGSGSDGLLTFRDIFDLHLDADLVILSACDTAGKASAAATQQAGLGTGGDVALDGLVRAFVGAGARLVVASHWPVPDDFNATQRLITGLFSAPPGTPTVRALRLSQRELMDDVNTSHPFYWSAFAAVGDGEMPVIRAHKANIAQAQ